MTKKPAHLDDTFSQPGGPYGDWFVSFDLPAFWSNQEQLDRGAIAQPIAMDIFKNRKDVYHLLTNPHYDPDTWEGDEEATKYMTDNGLLAIERVGRASLIYLTEKGRDVWYILNARG